jgi:toxin FitB
VTGFLLDTSVLSEPMRPRPDPRVVGWIDSCDEALLFVSVLTLGEIRKGLASLPIGSRRSQVESWLADVREWFAGRILSVDEGIADRWGSVTAAARKLGRGVPAVDTLLAATALHHNLVLVTRNTGEVAGTGVSIFNPWQ